MKIKEIPVCERPRERLQLYGCQNISNEDLIAVIIKSGCKNNSVRDIALEILKKIENIHNLDHINKEMFRDIKGLGEVRILELMAAIELGRRIYLEKEVSNKEKWNHPDIIYKRCRSLFKGLKQEYFYCLYLDNKNHLIERKLLFMGTINRSVVHPREIFKEAYLLSSSGIICMHNHPSGDIMPSDEDIMLTKTLVDIGRMQGVRVLDHLIVTDNDYFSFCKNNMIE